MDKHICTNSSILEIGDQMFLCLGGEEVEGGFLGKGENMIVS